MAIYCLRKYKYIYTQQQVPRLVIISSCVQNRSLYSDFQIWSRCREINAKSCYQMDGLVMGTKACLWISYNNTFSVWYPFWNIFQSQYSGKQFQFKIDIRNLSLLPQTITHLQDNYSKRLWMHGFHTYTKLFQNFEQL